MRKYFIYFLLLLTVNAFGQRTIGRFPFYVAPVVIEEEEPPGPGIDTTAWEAEYKTVFYAMSEGDRPALDTADFQNELVKDLKEALGDWSRVKALWVLAQKTIAGARVNWSNPGTYNLTDVSSTPTFTSYVGAKSSGSNCFNSGLKPSDMAQNSVSVTVCMQENTQRWTMECPIGCRLSASDNEGLHILPMYSGAQWSYVNTYVALEPDVDSGTGIHSCVRSASNVVSAYYNEELLDTKAHVSWVPISLDMYVLARNANNSMENPCTATVSLILVADAVTTAEVADVHIAIEKYNISLDIPTQ